MERSNQAEGSHKRQGWDNIQRRMAATNGRIGEREGEGIDEARRDWGSRRSPEEKGPRNYFCVDCGPILHSSYNHNSFVPHYLPLVIVFSLIRGSFVLSAFQIIDFSNG